MNLKDFAESAGVKIHRCEKEWGGTYGYKTPDAPNCSFNGYKTEAEAYKAWAYDAFGENCASALIALLKKTK